MRTLLADIEANRLKLAGCRRHHFPYVSGPGETRELLRAHFRTRLLCEHCEGRMPAGDVLAYCEGFAAAGGDPNLVLPNFR